MLRFGVGVWRTDFQTLRSLCLASEELGFSHFFYGEGLGIECYTALAALASITKTVRLGPGITFLTYRHPVIMAKMGASLDVISEGRFEIRFGAGGAPGYGVNKPEPEQLVGQLAEGLKIIRALWSEGKSNFEGRFFTVRDALCDIRPLQHPSPPITIAAKGDKMLRLVAEHADSWESPSPPAELARRLERLREACEHFGRDPESIRKIAMLRVFIGRTNEEAEEIVKRHVERRGVQKARVDMLKSRDAIGDPEACVKKLSEYAALGVEQFTFLFPEMTGKDLGPLRLFADRVMPALT